MNAELPESIILKLKHAIIPLREQRVILNRSLSVIDIVFKRNNDFNELMLIIDIYVFNYVFIN